MDIKGIVAINGGGGGEREPDATGEEGECEEEIAGDGCGSGEEVGVMGENHNDVGCVVEEREGELMEEVLDS